MTSQSVQVLRYLNMKIYSGVDDYVRYLQINSDIFLSN